MSTHPLCTLRDCTIEYVSDDGILSPIPGEIYSIEELTEYLRLAAAWRPYALRMDLPGSFCAWIHIGGPLGAVHLTRVYLTQPIPADAPGGWIALPDRPLPMSEFISFLTEGSKAEDDIYGDQLLPVADVIQIAVYLAEHRTLPPSHGWVCHYGNGTCTYVAKKGFTPPAEIAAMESAEPFSPNGQRLREEEDYLRAIAACPHDRLLRRLYADWLEAYHPRRTELIRVCEAMRDVPVWSDRYWELKARRNELWEHCPLDWLEATGYDGSYYDPIFRDGVPDGWRERWRLIREFTERWHGIPVPDAGGQQARVAQVEERLGSPMPPSLREYVAYIDDVADSSPPHDPRRYNTLFHSAYSLLHPLHRHPAVSLIHSTLDSSILGVLREDLTTSDPPAYFFDEVIDEHGVPYPPSPSRPHRPPILCAPTTSLSIFQNLFIQLPTAGHAEDRCAETLDRLPPLAAAFPVHAQFDDAHVFEADEVLVLVSGRGQDYLVQVVVRRPVPPETLPGYLFGGTRENIGLGGMLDLEWYRRQLETKLQLPGAPQPGQEGHALDRARFDLQTYRAWVRYAGFYPVWLSILRRREAEHCAAENGTSLGADQPLQSDTPPFQWDGDIPF